MVTTQREKIDILDLSSKRRHRHGPFLNQKAEQLLEQVKATGQIIDVTLEGEVVGQIGPTTTPSDLFKLMAENHPGLRERLTTSAKAAEAELKAGTATGLDVEKMLALEHKVVDVGGKRFTVGELARAIVELEDLYDIDREDLAEAFTTDGVLDEQNAGYIRFKRLYSKYLEATGFES